MDENSKNYFTNLARGGDPEAEPAAASVPVDIDQDISTLEAAEIKTVKADHIAVKSRFSRSKASRLEKSDSDSDPDSGFETDDLSNEPEGQLTVDVYQTDDDLVVQSTVAGVSQNDLVIDVNGESVSIRGRRRRPEPVRDEDYFYQECYWGRFSRTVILPQEINPDKARASLKDGVLTIHLPKLERERSKKLRIKVS